MKKKFAVTCDNGHYDGDYAVGHHGSADGYKVGIANREITNDYNRLIAYGAQDILEEAGCEVTMTDAEADFQKHNENIETLLNSGIDALIIQLGDNDQLAPLCEKATDMGDSSCHGRNWFAY